MKIKHILKPVGLLTLFSFLSIALISCDDNDESSSNSNSGGSSGGSELPENVSDLQNGGTFNIKLSDGSLNFRITDLDAKTGTLIEDDDQDINNLTFEYVGQNLTITDNRVTPEVALIEFNQLVGPGGAAQYELNELLANDNEGNVEALTSAVNSVTEAQRFLVDYYDDTRVFIIRQLVFSANSPFSISGTLITGENHPFNWLSVRCA
jgi:hypothetical protein